MLTLEDLNGLSEEQIIEHLINDYSGKYNYGGFPTDKDRLITKDKLSNLEVLIAYESVGDYGCDSSSFFLFRDKTTGMLYEQHGSHCSCYGFEGQLSLEETNIESLLFRVENADQVFSCGGYDDNSKSNIQKVNDYIKELSDN